ncbi:hypothetical protein L2E82_35773 [Cichorium intybus]|uniref:Uncharacterized protein n=1 Tax=Cichorium intybus TaxID=13427 RepID=A0ACB9BPQ6_CICIN|nr:hypothetical protein L2E82_35773 [Cichorium intybus]
MMMMAVLKDEATTVTEKSPPSYPAYNAATQSPTEYALTPETNNIFLMVFCKAFKGLGVFTNGGGESEEDDEKDIVA